MSSECVNEVVTRIPREGQRSSLCSPLLRSALTCMQVSLVVASCVFKFFSLSEHMDEEGAEADVEVEGGEGGERQQF